MNVTRVARGVASTGLGKIQFIPLNPFINGSATLPSPVDADSASTGLGKMHLSLCIKWFLKYYNFQGRVMWRIVRREENGGVR